MAYSEAIALYEADCREKKNIAHSAKRRVRHKWGYNAPERTPEEVSALNGPCTTYNLEAAMTWEQFTELPYGIQTEYLRGLAKRYGASEQHLSELFQASDREVHTYLQCNVLTGIMKRAQTSQFDAEGWEQFKTRRSDVVAKQTHVPSYAERLRAQREAMGMTQKQLAEELNCSTAKISRAENNRSDYMAIIMLLTSAEKLFSQKKGGKSDMSDSEMALPAEALAEKKQLRGALALSGASDTILSALARLLDDPQKEVTVTLNFE